MLLKNQKCMPIMTILLLSWISHYQTCELSLRHSTRAVKTSKLTRQYSLFFPNSVPLPIPRPIHTELTTESPLISSRVESTQSEKKNKLKMEDSVVDPNKLRADFIQLLRSRRSSEVPLRVELANPVTNPMYQDNPPPPPSFREAMESCPKADIDDLKDLLVEENLYLYTEASEQGRLPVLILSMKQSGESKRPAIVFLHSTHKCKEWLRPLLEAYASRGYIAIAIDSRYHGERADSLTTYREALVSSWKKGDTMPFIYDTVIHPSYTLPLRK